MNGFHTTSINDNIDPTPDDLIAVAIKAGLNKKDALLIFEEMKNRIIRNYCRDALMLP
jgi:serine/threonine-protein kinase HipA